MTNSVQYNYMNSITITGPEQAILAGTWAEKNIRGDWKMNLVDPFSNQYHFIFTDPQDASHFALKWR